VCFPPARKTSISSEWSKAAPAPAPAPVPAIVSAHVSAPEQEPIAEFDDEIEGINENEDEEEDENDEDYEDYEDEDEHEHEEGKCTCTFSWILPHSHWDTFQLHADRFFMLFVMRHGETSVFKYLHSLGAGHFSEQGKIFGNLAIFSQQAVESVQGEHTAFVAHCTQRGGEIGKAKIKTSTNLDILRWTQRKLIYPLLREGKVELSEKVTQKLPHMTKKNQTAALPPMTEWPERKKETRKRKMPDDEQEVEEEEDFGSSQSQSQSQIE